MLQTSVDVSHVVTHHSTKSPQLRLTSQFGMGYGAFGVVWTFAERRLFETGENKLQFWTNWHKLTKHLTMPSFQDTHWCWFALPPTRPPLSIQHPRPSTWSIHRSKYWAVLIIDVEIQNEGGSEGPWQGQPQPIFPCTHAPAPPRTTQTLHVNQEGHHLVQKKNNLTVIIFF